MSANLLNQLKKIYAKTTSVIDATEPLTLDVTKADIKRSKRKDLNNCALAVACKRGNGMSPDFVIASRSRLYTVTAGVATRYGMPDNAVREITSFDRGATFTPGEYTVHPLSPCNQLGCDRRNTAKSPHNKNPAPVHQRLIDNIRATIKDV